MIESMVTMPAIVPPSRRQTRNPSVAGWAYRTRYARNSSGVTGTEYHGWCSPALARASARNSS